MINWNGKIPEVIAYGTAADYCQLPSLEQACRGVIPLDSLPAAWWNKMWHDNNEALNCSRAFTNNVGQELCNIIVCRGGTINENCNSQLYSTIFAVGTADKVGMVKSSTTNGQVSIASSGVMTVNGYGNAALQTTAQTVTEAINELKDAIDNFQGVTYSDTAPLVNGTAAAGTSDTAARGDHVHPIGCCIKGSDTTYVRSVNGLNFMRTAYSNCLYTADEFGNNQLFAEGCCADNRLCVCGRYGINYMLALGADGQNKIYTIGCCGYNNIGATGDCGYNRLYTCGLCSYTQLCATGIYGYNELFATGSRGCNLLQAYGQQGKNILRATGYDSVNLIEASGCQGSNMILACNYFGKNCIYATGATGRNEMVAHKCNHICAACNCIISNQGINTLQAPIIDLTGIACDASLACPIAVNIQACTIHATCPASICMVADRSNGYAIAKHIMCVGGASASNILTSGASGIYICASRDTNGECGSIMSCTNIQAHWARDYNPEITEDGPSYTIEAASCRTRACSWCADCNCWSRWSPRIYLCASGSDTPPAAGEYASGVATLAMFATRPNSLYTAGDGETLDGNRLEQVGIACFSGNKLYIGVGPIPAASCCCATPASCYNVGDEVVIDLNQWMVLNNCTYPPTLRVRGGAVQAIHHLDAVCVKYCCTGTQSTSCYCYDLYIREAKSSGIGAYANRACLRFFNMQRSALWPAPAAGTGWIFTGTSITGPASSSGTCTLEKGLMMYDAW